MGETEVVVSNEVLAKLQELPKDDQVFITQELAACSRSFRRFLDYWYFLDQDTGVVRCLGQELWDAQEEFVSVVDRENWIFNLKARQLGFTTIECAYDAWVARVRGGGRNARVHVFSKRETEAISLLARVTYGYKRLPWWMQLPVSTDRLSCFAIKATKDDIRQIYAYPADNDTARGETCTHAHIDEWAFMGSPQRVWQSIEPSAAGTIHFITTGQGPANYTSAFWRRCLARDVVDRKGNPVYACFIGALNRPDRNEAWLKAKRAGMDEQAFLQEYPMRWQDALSGGGDYVFRSSDLDHASEDTRGLQPPRKGRRYVKGWDVGRHQDAAVCVVLDVTDDVHDVVHYVRLRGCTYPDIQQAMETIHATYPGITAVEKNAAGEAVLENVKIPAHEREGFSTTGSSKPRILQNLKIAVQGWLIKWDPSPGACDQLDVEMRGYQIPDDNVVQDSVMALAIAEEYAGKELMRVGRARSPVRV